MIGLFVTIKCSHYDRIIRPLSYNDRRWSTTFIHHAGLIHNFWIVATTNTIIVDQVESNMIVILLLRSYSFQLERNHKSISLDINFFSLIFFCCSPNLECFGTFYLGFFCCSPYLECFGTFYLGFFCCSPNLEGFGTFSYGFFCCSPNLESFEGPSLDVFVAHLILRVLGGPPWMFSLLT